MNGRAIHFAVLSVQQEAEWRVLAQCRAFTVRLEHRLLGSSRRQREDLPPERDVVRRAEALGFPTADLRERCFADNLGARSGQSRCGSSVQRHEPRVLGGLRGTGLLAEGGDMSIHVVSIAMARMGGEGQSRISDLT